jgi:hypothetical protein
MNGIDVANQLRGTFTCHRPHNLKWWRPLFYWLIDTCKTNAFLIWKESQSKPNTRLHQTFFNALIDELLAIPLKFKWDPTNLPRAAYTPRPLKKPTYCAWGIKHPGMCVQGSLGKRKFGDTIVNESRPNGRPRQVRTGCFDCDEALCIKGNCWNDWHAEKTV